MSAQTATPAIQPQASKKVEEDKRAKARRLETLNLIRGNSGKQNLLVTGPEQTSKGSAFPVLIR